MPIPLIIWAVIGVLALFFGWQFLQQFQQLQNNWLIILIIVLLVLIIILLI